MTKASHLLKWKKLNKVKKEFQPLASGFLAAGAPDHSFTLMDGQKLCSDGRKDKGHLTDLFLCPSVK